MRKNNYAVILILILLLGCMSQLTMPAESIAPVLSTQSPLTLNQVLPETPTSMSTVEMLQPYPTFTQNPQPLSTPTLEPLTVIQPVINHQPGDLYETVFRIPISSQSIIKYQELPGAIFGPIAFAILPDDTFLIAVHTTDSNHLLNYDQDGHLLKTIDLDNLGITFIADLRIRGADLYLLEIPYEGGYRIHHLSLIGDLISSDEIPRSFPSSSGKPLASGEVSIAIDCDKNVLMVVEGGFKVYLFSDVLNLPNPNEIKEGYPCNEKYYRVIGLEDSLFKFNAGDVTYETRLTNGFGGVYFLEVFMDGSFYVVRNDVIDEQLINVDQTIHFIDASGIVLGLARIPLSEFYYPIIRNADINSSGEVFVLVPRPDSLEVIRVNFYEKLPPLLPGGVSPEIKE